MENIRKSEKEGSEHPLCVLTFFIRVFLYLELN
jgi:hypothetical protein